MKKGFSVLFFLAFALGLYCLAPINNPPGGTGSTGPQGSPGVSGSPGPQGSPGPNTIAATTAVLKGDNAGGAVAATANTDYSNPAGVQALIDAKAGAAAHLIGVASDGATLDWATGVMAGAAVVFTSSNGILEITFASPVVGAQYSPMAISLLANSACRISHAGESSFAFRFFNSTTGDPIDPGEVWVSITR